MLIGVVLGLIGGGGSILTLPLLDYFFGIPVLLATTYSLFIVGSASFIGVLQRIRPREIAIREGLVFAIPSTLFTVLTRQYIIPWIPEHLELDTFDLTRETILKSVFIALMLITALRLLIRKERHIRPKPGVLIVLLYGALTGLLAGLIGAGGGFIIVPILISTGLSTKRAIGTSMLIITIQSGIALIGDFNNPTIPVQDIKWFQLLLLSALTIVGVLVGSYLQRFFKGDLLRKVFAMLLLLVALSVGVDLLFK